MIVNSDQIIQVYEELKRRADHCIHTYTPGEVDGWNQKAFHESEARYRLLFGGNQSGKSRSAAFEISCWLRGKHPYRNIPSPPNKIWSISAEYSTLVEGVYRHLWGDPENRFIPDWEIDDVGPNVPQQRLPTFIRLKNGSQVDFKSAKGDTKAREKFQAAEVDLISIDEEVVEAIWTELQARTMARGGQFIISATLVESYDWIVKLQDLALSGNKSYFLTRLDSRQNPHLHQETIEHLAESWSQEEQEVRFQGKTRRSVGLVYKEWDNNIHRIKPFPIPEEWPRWRIIDPGLRIFAVLWGTISPDNHAYAYRELYAYNESLWETVKAIKAAERWKLDKGLTEKFGHAVWEAMDDSEYILECIIDDKRGSRLITGEQGILGQLETKFGINCVPADKSMRPGIESVRYWLSPRKDGKPGFMCFSTLENFLNEVRRYRIRTKRILRDANEPIDEPIRKNNHLMDCWRYWSMSDPRWEDRKRTDQLFKIRAGFDVNPFERLERQRRSREFEDSLLGTEW
jgi:hypothetical protein